MVTWFTDKDGNHVPMDQRDPFREGPPEEPSEEQQENTPYLCVVCKSIDPNGTNIEGIGWFCESCAYQLLQEMEKERAQVQSNLSKHHDDEETA